MATDNADNRHFIHDQIDMDLADGVYPHVRTRFPPEPNGYLHIGHAKAICINFSIAKKYGGQCNLRMDDTNPAKEEAEYIQSIQEDIRWLGFEWDNLYYASSDYFDTLYEWAGVLVDHGHAYVDDQNAEQIRDSRGTLKEPGKPSPFRDRTPKENREQLEAMRAGEVPDGQKVLRAKIDMAAPNMNLRDPVMYRVLHKPHPHVGDKWCIYPSYDWTHGQSDWMEGVTHSLCSLEFEDHRPLYDWFIDTLISCGVKSPACNYRPRQIEFARGNITYMTASKRLLLPMIERNVLAGWNDPRMPTLRGMRRRGYTPEAIRRFWDEAGVAKRVNNIEFAKLESVLRDDLNKKATRRMAVLDPIKVVITNYPEGEVEYMPAVNNPEDESAGSRDVPFARDLFIERDDFMEDPPKKFFRLGPGREVRLRYAYWITCTDVVKDDAGNIIELHCTYDPQTRGGDSPPPDADGNVRKVKGTLHWVSAGHAVDAEVRLYDHLFVKENPLEVEEGGDWIDNVNPDSLTVVHGAKLEPALAEAAPGEPIQFERLGYFTADRDATPQKPVFNRTATLRDTWAKMQQK